MITFLDDNLRFTCIPCSRVSELPDGVTQCHIQRAQYSRHKHHHGFKAHALIFPCGLVAHYHGPVDGRRHDVHLLRVSGILDRLHELNHNNVDYAVHSMHAYVHFMTPNLITSIPRVITLSRTVEAQLNEETSMVSRYRHARPNGGTKSLRTRTFQALDFTRWQSMRWLTLPPLRYFTCMLILKFHTCINMGNTISRLFNSEPPTLDRYLQGHFCNQSECLLYIPGIYTDCNEVILYHNILLLCTHLCFSYKIILITKYCLSKINNMLECTQL